MKDNKWANDTLLGISLGPKYPGNLVWASKRDDYEGESIMTPDTSFSTEPKPHSCMDHKPPPGHNTHTFTCPCGKRWKLADVWPGNYWEPI